MKRNQTLLLASACLLVGFLIGFLLNSSLSSNASGAGSFQGAPRDASGAPVRVDAADAKARWENPYASKFAGASANSPTPGISDAIGDALHLDPQYGEARLLLLIESMRKEDFPVAFEILRKAKTMINTRSVGQQGPAMWTAFWQRFGELDPDEALQAALSATTLTYERRESLEKHLFTGMAWADPTHAAAALLAHPELLHQDRAIEGLMFGWTTKDAPAAIAWACKNLEPEKLKTALYATAWGVSTATDISAATKILAELPPDVPKESIITSIKSQIRNKEELPVPQILDFITATRAVGASDHNFEMTVALRCAERDPFASAEFFARSPGGDPSKPNMDGLRVVVSQWAALHPEAAESWAKGQSGTPHYAMVAGVLAQAAKQRGNTEAEQRWQAAAAQK